MSFLSQEKINEIRDSVDIVNVISNYVALTPKGKNFINVSHVEQLEQFSNS